MQAMRLTHVPIRLAVLIALLLSRPAADAQSNGIPARRPIFGGSCPTCPWGALGDAVKEAMQPSGYDVGPR